MPACGLLGDFGWLAEHLEHTTSLGGRAFPDWVGSWGCRSNLAKATGLVQGSTADPDSIRAALTYLLGLPPLGWSKETLQMLAVQGHSPHGTLSDLGRTIGSNPSFPFEVDEAAGGDIEFYQLSGRAV
eukprot:scaffold9776_cov126-Isochrysis_galbana.AAC.15